MIQTRMRWAAAACAAVLLVAGQQARAQYPSKPVRVVIPFPPGGSADVVGRAVMQEAGKSLGQPIVPDNRPGAGGNIAAEMVARAPADGHTLFFGIGSVVTTNPWLYKDLKFDPLKDLVPVSLISIGGYVLIAHPKAPFNSFPEMIRYARANPGKLTYASYGNGSAVHLAMEMLKSYSGAFILHIPYRGAAPALTDVMAGQVDIMFDVFINSLPQVQAGRVKALATSTLKRWPQFPNTPAVAETIPGFNAEGWQGVFVPAGTPAAVVERLNAEISKALREPSVDKRLRDAGLEPQFLSPGQFAEFVRADHAKWGKVIRERDIKSD